MLDLKTLTDILEAEKKDKRSSCRRLIKKTGRMLKDTRKLLADESDFVCMPAREDAARWLYENFSRLEETVKSCIHVLKKLPKLAGGGDVPLFYKAFSYTVRKNPELSCEEIRSIFGTCNEYGGGISIEDAQSLAPLFGIAVCMRICECFLVSSEEKASDENSDIRQLFYTLDELSLTDDEAVFENNAVERILQSDPSGIYLRLAGSTRSMYRKNLVRLAKRFGMSQKDLAQTVVKKCAQGGNDGNHIGKYLCDKPCGGKTYMFLVFFMTSLFTLLLCLISPVFLIAVFSVYGCSRLIADKFFVRFFVKDFHLPRMELEKIPDGYGVMTVITSLLTGGTGDDGLFEKLEMMYNSNGEKNAYFGLLCDLPDSDEKEVEKDSEIINSAQEKILALRKKYGNSFFFFVREREYSESEEKYIAPERKRGAVNALAAFLCGKSDGFCRGSIKPDEKICENIKYVFTLDADTNLAFDCLKTMVGIMMHPQNKPIVDIEKNAVTRGYGILQPAMNPTLQSSQKSFFSSVMCGHGGVDFYSAGGSDAMMSMFGRSIFCGKGMFDKDCFYETLCGEKEFGHNSVLSHDAPEGARLRCAYVSDVTLTDSFPSEELSYYKRQHRWIRGDVQNIPFLFKYVKTCDGGRIRNGIGSEAKFFIWQNVYSALLPVFTVLTLFAAVLCKEDISVLLASAALAVYILPFGYSVFMGAKRTLWHNFRRLFYSGKIYSGVWTSFLKMIFRLCALPKSAFVSADAIIRSTYRSLVSHKKMLEWTTAAQNDAEKKDGVLGYVKKNLVNAVCGALIFTLSTTGFLKLLGLMWLFMPVFSYHSGKERKAVKKPLSEAERNTLTEYCGDMWKFFSENVSEKTNHLPTDNLALYPERKLSRMTSPTNIGLYLLSALCARRLGFIDDKEVCSRIISCLETTARLEKYKGLLYNWYDIFKAEPMTPRYISSVDIGNYVACLICVKEGITELCGNTPDSRKICCLCTELIEETDFSLLFDYSKKLFYIGAEEREKKLCFDRNRYDMLMSEARILSFCAVAKRRVPSEHIRRLSRRFVEGKGYMGLASWSGTAFEFFMPEIFMPSKEGSLVYEALCFAYTNMRRNGAGHGSEYVFGISESCYNEFDSASNYKYHAFGVPEIALNVFEKQKVISPYSSFLFMKMSRREVMKNLERLKKLGAYGEYGFFESVDFERPSGPRKYSVVECFMSHHAGMSIAACVNVLCDGAVSEWFGKDEKIKSALELTQERIPYDVYVKRSARRHYIKNAPHLRISDEGTLSDMFTAKLRSGSLEIVAKKGKLDVKTDRLLLTRKNCFPDSLSSFEAGIIIDGEKFYFDKKCRISADNGQAVISKTLKLHCGDKFESALSVTAGNNTSDTLRMRIRLRQLSGERNKNVTFFLSFYPLLDTKQNSRVCSFFDSSDYVLNRTNNDTEIYFRRFSANMCICAGCVDGKDKTALVDGEKASVVCGAVNRDGVMHGEFALAVSDSTKCAQTGLVRCREDSFSETSEKLRQRQQKQAASLNPYEGPKRLTGVLGCSVVKETAPLGLPLDSSEAPLYLMSSGSFSTLAARDALGMSFENDINDGRVTDFSGTDSTGLQGEILFLDDGFDLCKMSTKAYFSDNRAVYEGVYQGKKYRLCVFAACDMPCKIIITEGIVGKYINLEIMPSDKCDGERHIGAGLAFFGKRGSTAQGFCFGVCEDGNGAEYTLSDTVNATLFAQDEASRCVFCIGKADEERANDIYNRVRNNLSKIIDGTEHFSKSILIKPEYADVEITDVTKKYFVFPKDKSCKRVFVKSRDELFLFDTLLLMYTDYPEKRSFLIKAFDMNFSSCISASLCCLVLSEYVRLTKDRSVMELKIRGETLYKRCLACLSDTFALQEENDIFLLALERFSRLCNDLGDLRTGLSLSERLKKIKEKGNGGIFL